MFNVIRWLVGALLTVSGVLQLLGLPGDMPSWFGLLHMRLGWREILNVAMIVLGLGLIFGPVVKHFFERVLFRRYPVTLWQKAGLESKHREK